jgi:hypothetical protein
MYEESWGFDCRTDQRRLLFAQGPTNTLSSVRSYFEGMMTGDRAFRLRARILEEENREPGGYWGSVISFSLVSSCLCRLWPNSLRLHLPKLHQRATNVQRKRPRTQDSSSFYCEPVTRILMPLNVPQIPKCFFILVAAIHDLCIVRTMAFDSDN